MNPPFLPNTYNDDEQLYQSRNYNNPTTLISNDYSSYLPRRSQHDLNDTPLNQTLSIPNSTGGLEYNPHPSIPDHSYNPDPSFLLSTPPSLSATHVNGIVPASSTFLFSGTPKSLASNATPTEHFPTPVPQYTNSLWTDSTMTDTQNRRPPALHPQMPPPVNYSSSNGITGSYLTTSNNHYPSQLPFNSQYRLGDMRSATFNNNNIIRSPAYAPLVSPTGIQLPYPGPYHYTPMSPQPPQPPQPQIEGPPFGETKIIHQLVTSRNLPLSPEISAIIPKGFFQVDEKWTCYRRNYFLVACAFTFKNGLPSGTVFLQRHNQHDPVHGYSISLSACTAGAPNQEVEPRQLVQHTPKRDKATESTPDRHPVQPASPQSLQPNGTLSGSSLYAGNQHNSVGMLSNFDVFSAQSHSASAPTSYTFERIQFQKATANNGKRRAQQQYFQIVVELSVNISRPTEPDEWIVVATRGSADMVVRGRSPGHYKDNIRHDSHSNMDQDRGSGSNNDGGLINLPAPYNHYSSMDIQQSQRQSSHYSGHFHRHNYGTDYSPYSPSSSSMTASPEDVHYSVEHSTDPKFTLQYDLGQSGAATTSIHPRNLLNQNKKRPFQEDEAEGDAGYYSSIGTEDSLSPRPYLSSGPPSVRPLGTS